MKHTRLWLILLLAVISAALHYAGSLFYFYWTYWWYDFLVHFIVGATGGLSLYWGFFESGLIFQKRFNSRLISILFVFVAVMIWGLGWEWFEYATDLTYAHEIIYLRDVLHDLLMDGLGALITSLWVSKTNNG